MKLRTIRDRFFGALAIYTFINFLLVGLVVVVFDVHEYHQDPSLKQKEVEEILIVWSVMLLLFPASLVVAWWVSRWLLRPWRAMVEQAEIISEGRLEDRIEVENPEDEIGRLAATLNHTFDEYQDILDRMRRFSYDASHQLRNPLAAIRAKGEICLKHTRSEAEYRDVIGDILDSSVRLSRTVSQLLLLASAASGALDEHRESTDLRNLIQGVLQEAVLIGELRYISVGFNEPEDESVITCVPYLVREALSNLVDNALKFTPSGGRIEIALSRVPKSRWRIEVADSGPGLSGAQRARIFRPFERELSHGREGTGLGLAIVADVCRAHNGEFGVDGSSLGGCLFWMEFPV